MEHGIFAFAFLLPIIRQSLAGGFSHDETGGDVNQCHDPHENIGEVPSKPCGELRAHEDDDCCQEAIKQHEGLIFGCLGVKIADIHFGIEIIADQSGEGKKREGNGDENAAGGAEICDQRILNIGGIHGISCGIHIGGGIQIRTENHEGSGGADEDGVDKDGEHLHQTLLGRVGNIGRSGGIRGRADAGFIGIQTALDAVHHGCAQQTAEHGFRAEGFAEDADKDEGQSPDMQENDNDCCKNINTCHDGDEYLCNLRDALAAAQNDDTCQNGNDGTDIEGRLLARYIDLDEISHIEGGKGIKAAHIGEDEGNGKGTAQKRRAKPLFDIIGRAAIGAMLALFLINLCEGGFDKGGGTADDGDEPHPEHCTCAACDDGTCYADHVAGSDTGGGGDHKRLKRGNGFPVLSFFRDDANRFPKQAELDKACLYGEIKTCCDEQGNQNIAIQKAADKADDICKCFHRILLSKKILLLY